jgi:hypothetical protein
VTLIDVLLDDLEAELEAAAAQRSNQGELGMLSAAPRARLSPAGHSLRQRSCTLCGSVFEAARVDARYCSARCRQRASRAERR